MTRSTPAPRKRAVPIGEITAETTQWYLDDMDALGACDPDP